MQDFRNILFVSDGLTDDLHALQQALSIARNNKAQLRALIVCPEFPKELAKYRERYETSLIQQLSASIQAARQQTGVSETEFPIRPCPVWLSRPIPKHRGDIKLAVAIDPQSNEPEGRDLSLRLLQLSRSLADTCSGELTIISCWDYPLEEYLRNNSWINMPDDELIQTVIKAQTQHRAALNKTMKQSGLGGKVQVQHVRGRADQIIPQFIADSDIDILVMGTVGRTGIPGFIIGNTAENVVQKLNCSLLALKPNGFFSPVKAYR